MPRDGSLMLSDVRGPTLARSSVNRAAGAGRHNGRELITQRTDGALPSRLCAPSLRCMARISSSVMFKPNSRRNTDLNSASSFK